MTRRAKIVVCLFLIIFIMLSFVLFLPIISNSEEITIKSELKVGQLTIFTICINGMMFIMTKDGDSTAIKQIFIMKEIPKTCSNQ